MAQGYHKEKTAMYSYDQVLTDVREVYEQLTGLPAPRVDVKKPQFPLPRGVDPVAYVQSEINYLNLHLINSGLSLRLSKTPTWTPAAEVYETPDQFVISLELAGVRKEDVTVQQNSNVLTVRGSRRFRKANEEAQYHNSERVYGTFERLFSIPNTAHGEPKTNFVDGIMQITFSKPTATPAGGTE
jgi:HSP20 family protein